MAKRKKKAAPGSFDLGKIQGAVYGLGLSEGSKLLLGIGALLAGYGMLKYAPQTAGTLLPALFAAFTPRPDQFRPALPPPLGHARAHPEALEPVRTMIDERQLGRSEVFRAIARPLGN